MNASGAVPTPVPTTSAVYESVLDAAYGLLGEVALILETTSEDHVIVGGWSPLLLNSSPLPHPGTRDVDVLFSDGATPGALRGVVECFLDSGYLPSAKHDFQLLRVLQVGPRQMVFNLDLLHPSENEFEAGMFVDHLDLGVAASELMQEHLLTRSIVAPHAAFIIEDGRSARLGVPCRLPSNQTVEAPVSVVDELGLIVSKSKSVGVAKRPRDAFDIGLAVTQARVRSELEFHTLTLREQRPEVFSALAGVRAAFAAPGITERLSQYLPEHNRAGEARRMVQGVHQFLLDVGIDGGELEERRA